MIDDPGDRAEARRAAVRDLAAATLALRSLPRDEDAGRGLRASADASLRPLLETLAAWTRADVARELRLLRLAAARGDAAAGDRLAPTAGRVARWDAVRRHLHEATNAVTLFRPEGAPVEGVDLLRQARAALRARTTAAARRQVELDQQAAVQAAAAGDATAGRAARPALHVALELSGEGPAWGLVAGSDAGRVGAAYGLSPEADAPGYHQRVLGHFAAAAAGAVFPGLNPTTLRDPSAGRLAVPGPLVHAGFLAGTHGFFNAAVATCHDARRRDGHPGDTLAALDTAGFAAQGEPALRLIRAALGLPGLPARAPFADKAIDNRAGTRRPSAVAAAGAADDAIGVPVGPVVQQRVAGGLAEDRPAPGAVVALFPLPADPANAWNSLARAGLPSYEPARLVLADGAGRFDVVGAHADLDRQLATVGATHDDRGVLRAVSTQERLGGSPAAALRTDLLGLSAGVPGGDEAEKSTPADGSAVVTLRPDEPVAAGRFTVLLGAAGSRPRPADALVGQVGPFGFYHLAPGLAEGGVRIFQPGGALLLPPGEGAGEADAEAPPAEGASVLLASAKNLWALNESRLAALRARGILRGDLERLHGASLAALDASADAAAGGETAARAARLAFALGQRVYGPLRSAMDDLVNAVVLLLALAVPFAFFGERLLVGAKGIRGRVAGFAACFGLTFAALYALHPGFAVASTPVIVFLAFAILLLSGLVIVLLISKFRVQLAKLHGEGGHSQNAGQVAALLAAVQMGISTMRRRKTRTALTTLTVVVLTFTVLCFAGFERRLGVATTAVGSAGPGTPTDAVLVRRVDGGPLPRAAAELASAAAESGSGGGAAGVLLPAMGANGGGEALLSWRVDPAGVADGGGGSGSGLPLSGENGLADGRVRAVIGIDPEMPRRWPALAPGAGERRGLGRRAGAVHTGHALGRAVRRRRVPEPRGGAGVESRDRRPLPPERPARAARRRARRGAFRAAPPRRRPAAAAGARSRPRARRHGHRLRRRTQNRGGCGRPAVGLGGRGRGRPPRRGDGRRARLRHGLPRRRPRRGRCRGRAGHRAAPAELGGRAGGPGAACAHHAHQRERGGGGGGPADARRVDRLRHAARIDLRPQAGDLHLLRPGPGAQAHRRPLPRRGRGVRRGRRPRRPAARAAARPRERRAGAARPRPRAAGELRQRQRPLRHRRGDGGGAAFFALPRRRRRPLGQPRPRAALRLPVPEKTPEGGDRLDLVFPFTVSAADMGGVRAFLAEHFRQHDDAGTGRFACTAVENDAGEALLAGVALAPFDLGVSQRLRLWSEPSDLDGVDRVRVVVDRTSGTRGDFARLNKPFFADLRRQFLLWRTLPDATREAFRRGSTGVVPPPTP